MNQTYLMKNYFMYACVALMLLACNSQKSKKVVAFAAITAVPMPPTLSSGQKFPTPAATINGWVTNSIVVNNLETNSDILTHGWDIWAALTANTTQSNNGQTLRRFETWYTPGDVITALRAKEKNSTYKLEDIERSHTGYLKPPHQGAAHGNQVTGGDVVGFVKYDPSSASHIYNNDLYYFEKLKKMIKEGEIKNIPPFPNSSVIIKPVFYPLTKVDSLGADKYSLPAWPGYTGEVTAEILENGFGPSSWSNNIKITTTGKTNTAKKVYSINDFIHFKLTKEQAANIINVIDKGVAKEGDYAVLVGMHVNTRENRRWTWQTFWWSENPTAPHSPSSKAIAKLQDKVKLDAAAKHYAMAAAYSMISPVQPNTGGSNSVTRKEFIKESIYAYNPYLEAGFNAATFDIAGALTPDPKNPNSGGNPYVNEHYPSGYQNVGALKLGTRYVGGKLNKVGIESNCMSCHSQARIYDVPTTKETYQLYVTDQYVDLDAPYFKSSIVLDFVWSIQGNLMNKDQKKKY